jgi:hypothetical protein
MRGFCCKKWGRFDTKRQPISTSDRRRSAMSDLSRFQWRHFEADIILCTMRWYLRCALSDRDVKKLMWKQGVWVDHTTVFRWVLRYAPALGRRCRPSLRTTNDSYRMVVEQDHRFVKRCVNPGIGVGGDSPWHNGPSKVMKPCLCSAKARSREGPRGCPRPEPCHQPAVRVGRIARIR